MEVAVVRPDELGDDDLGCWRSFQRTPRLENPFLSPEFSQALGQVTEAARVAVVRDSGGVAAFFPYELRGRRVAGPPGGGLADCAGIVHRPGYRWDDLELLRACGLSSWAFRNLVGEQVPAAAHHVVRSACPVIELSAGYEDYIRTRLSSSRSFVQTMSRKRRKMEREVGEIRFEFQSGSEAVLRKVMAWKSLQYRSLGEWDRFANPAIVSLVGHLFRTRAPGCSGTLSVLHAGDRPAAAHFGLRSEGELTWWFPAFDPELAKYSPGTQLLLMMAEAAAGSSIGQINLGMGQHGYKDATKTSEVVVAKGRVDDGSVQAWARRIGHAPAHYLWPLVRGDTRLHRAVARYARQRPL